MEAAAVADRVILRQLLEFNACEFSRWDGRDPDAHGRFGYRYLDDECIPHGLRGPWLRSPDGHPCLTRAGGHIAGPALVRRGPPHSVAEFCVMPKYRRLGVGTAAAREVLGRFPGVAPGPFTRSGATTRPSPSGGGPLPCGSRRRTPARAPCGDS